MPIVEIDDATHLSLVLAARLLGVTEGEVVTRLVRGDGMNRDDASPSDPAEGVAVHADYEGHRTSGRFFTEPLRLEIVSGDLAGTSYKSVSEAAGAVVRLYKPSVNPSRNGWGFWIVTSTGHPLQTLRP